MNWPNIERKDAHNQWFWGNEWRSHGGCSGALCGQVGFFQLAIDLKDKYDLQTSLAATGF